MRFQCVMFEDFGDDKTSKQGHIVETIPGWANNVGQYLQAFMGLSRAFSKLGKWITKQD